MRGIFKREKIEVLFVGTLLQNILVEEWADAMMCTTVTSKVKAGSIIKVYGYQNGGVRYIVVNSNKSLGKNHGLYTDARQIVSRCKKV